MEKILVFDYDGTMHNTMMIYEPAFRAGHKKLVSLGLVKDEEVKSETIKSYIGINAKNLWKSLMPNGTDKDRDYASGLVGDGMEELIRSHKAVWYDGVKETLKQLKDEGYTLLVLSNCKVYYREAHWNEFNMGEFFTQFYDCESFGFIPKTEIIKTIAKERPGEYTVIGDRATDMDCAKALPCPFVGCLYGFCNKDELKDADYLINSFTELPKVLKERY